MEFYRPSVKGKGREQQFNGSTLVLVSLVCNAWVEDDAHAALDRPYFHQCVQQPIVSLANVAQLAADLLIHTLQLECVGALSAKYHIPVISPVDYVEVKPSSPALATAIEGT